MVRSSHPVRTVVRIVPATGSNRGPCQSGGRARRARTRTGIDRTGTGLSLIHISEPTRRTPLSSSAASDVYKRQSASCPPRGRTVVPASRADVLGVLVLERASTGRGRGCLLYTSPSPRDGLLSLRRQRQMCIRDSPHRARHGVEPWSLPVGRTC